MIFLFNNKKLNKIWFFLNNNHVVNKLVDNFNKLAVIIWI